MTEDLQYGRRYWREARGIVLRYDVPDYCGEDAAVRFELGLTRNALDGARRKIARLEHEARLLRATVILLAEKARLREAPDVYDSASPSY